MEELTHVLQYLLHPVVLVPLATLLATTLARRIIFIFYPHLEDTSNNERIAKFYRAILHLSQPLVGIGFAFACWKVPAADGGWVAQPASFVLVAGIFMGTASGWIWRLLKGALKRILKLSDDDVKMRMSSLPGGDPNEPPTPE